MNQVKSLIAVGIASLIVVGSVLVSSPQASAAAEQSDPVLTCSSESAISKTLRAGTEWSMCWQIDLKRGLILSDVNFASKLDTEQISVLDQIGIAQLNVPYDSGLTEYNDITSYGFGGLFLVPLTADQCPGGEILDAFNPARNVVEPSVCVVEEDSGPAYALGDGTDFVANGTDLVVRIRSKVGWYEYLSEYRFHDDGEVNARLGATGDLSPNDYVDAVSMGWPIGTGESDYAVNHYHSGFWRVDFGIGDGPQRVEKIDTERAAEQPTGTTRLNTELEHVATEGKHFVGPRESFRILNPESLNADGHARSYEIVVPRADAYNQNSATDYDIAFSQAAQTEIYASDNQTMAPGATQTEVTGFVANQQALTDPVAWVNVGFHHVVRDEDQSPMPIHWQGFTLYPRDFTAQSPIIDPSRLWKNGQAQPDGPSPGYPDRVEPGGGGGYIGTPLLGSMPADATGDLTPYASAHVDSYYNAEADGENGPQFINDGDSDTFWDGDAQPRPTTVTYSWPRGVTLDRSSVRWGEWLPYNALPSGYVIEYLAPGGIWTEIAPTMGSFEGYASGVDHVIEFTDVRTTSIRIRATTNDAALLLYGWDVFSAGGPVTEPSPEPTVGPEPTPTSEPSRTPTSPSPDTSTEPAAPAPGSAGSVSAVADLGSAAVGARQIIRATGFAGDEQVRAVLHSDPVTIGTYRARPDGTVEFTFSVPQVEPGRHTLVLTGLTSGTVATVQFDVVQAAAITTWLAGTGATTAPTIGVGVTLFAAGVFALVFSAWRRRGMVGLSRLTFSGTGMRRHS